MDLITLALSKQFTQNAVEEAKEEIIKEVTGLEYEIVTELPSTGEEGVIYLLKIGDGSTDAYEEYIYIGGSFERLGYIDLTDYYTKEEINAFLSAKQDKLVSGTNIKTINGVSVLGSGDLDFLSNLAPSYDNTKTYGLNELVLHENKLYKCKTAITTAENWNSTHWTQTTLSEWIKGLDYTESI